MIITYFILFFIIAYSIILHEVAHGYVAYKLGDYTPKYEGRITLNPIPHIDPIGTLVLPLISFYLAKIIFGWAKPVLYNPYNLKNPQRDSIYIALAGPLINIFLALFFLLLYKLSSQEIWLLGLRINLTLAIFNLLPIPPLDGSKIFLYKLSLEDYSYLENFGFLIIFLFIFLMGNYFFRFVNLIQDFLLRL